MNDNLNMFNRISNLIRKNKIYNTKSTKMRTNYILNIDMRIITE